ncbi:hypothetical protein E4U59_005105 [Claviceps monticola]|nr:hypothetical protein E4U59_005105 [Claviceps monticola]
MATPPQGAGNSADFSTPMNATQGARDFLVNDDYQFDFDDFPGPRPSGSTNSDAAQQDSRTGFTPTAFGSTLNDSPRLQPSGSTLVTVGQDADRLITELDRDRAVKLELFRAMCAAFDQVAAGYASGPGHTLAQDFKQQYMRLWTAALKGKSPSPPPSRAAAPKPAATTTYASVASQPGGPTSFTLKTQRSSKRAAQRTKAPPAEDLRLLVRLEPGAPTWDKEAYAIRRAVTDRSEIPLHRVPAATRTKTGWAIKPTDAPTRHEVWHTYVVRNCPKSLLSLTGESIDVLEAVKEEVLTQTAQQPVDVHVAQ